MRRGIELIRNDEASKYICPIFTKAGVVYFVGAENICDDWEKYPSEENIMYCKGKKCMAWTYADVEQTARWGGYCGLAHTNT